MDKLLEMFKEDGVYSLTRVLPTIGYVVFIVVSILMAAFGKYLPIMVNSP